MSGYRANCGFGVLTRTATDSVGLIPEQYDVYNADSTRSQLNQLIHRFGAGIELTINRNRNNNYLQDIGYREFTTATSGMYDIDFTISGAFVPEMSSWLEYLMMSDAVEINATSKFGTLTGTGGAWEEVQNPADNIQGYVKNGATVGTTPILGADYKAYKAKTNQSTDQSTVPVSPAVGDVIKFTGTTTSTFVSGHYYRCTQQSPAQWADLGTTYEGNQMTFKVYCYVNMDGPKYMDIGYQLINNNTTNGGMNELGLLVGCVIDSASINYESGSDAQVKFTINGIALNEYIYTTNAFFDYNSILDYEIPLQPLVTGCVSVLKNGQYEPVAQTDSAGISINNNTTKLGNCLRLTYSSVTLGALGIEMNISTYANDPNKFMTYMYGYEQFAEGSQREIAKQPYGIDKMKIRSDNSSAIMKEGTQTLDLNLTKVYVGSANRSYTVGNAIMDEPDLRPRKVQIVVGYKSQ